MQSIWLVVGGCVAGGGGVVGVEVTFGAQAVNNILITMSRPISLGNLAFINLILLTIR
jgi:hypothetical protein